MFQSARATTWLKDCHLLFTSNLSFGIKVNYILFPLCYTEGSRGISSYATWSGKKKESALE